VSLPRQQKVIGRQHLEFIFDELLHPLDLIKLPLELNVVTHKQTHLMLGDGLQHLQGPLHDLIKHLLHLAALPVDILELGLSHRHQRNQVFLLLVQGRVHFF